MNSMTMRTAFMLLLLASFSIDSGFSNDRTGSGLAFLRIGVGARASGMGEAFVAVSDDASATYWNPAGCALIEKTEVMFMNNSFIQDISQEFVAVVTSFGDFKVGGAFNLVNLGTLEKRDETGELRGEFKPFDLAASFSLAYPVMDWVDVGTSVKGVMEDIDTETAYGALFDVGFILRLPVDGLSVGGVVQNIGPAIKFIDVAFDAPRTWRGGVSYVRTIVGFSSQVGLALDLVSPMDDDFQVNVGGEVEYNEIVAGRLGFRGGADTQGITTGIGVRYRGFIIDYAYVPFSENLGNTHRIGISYRFR
ncbi:MAG: PorV/PorQ family protein [Candidatus Glassbacteria bacterium]